MSHGLYALGNSFQVFPADAKTVIFKHMAHPLQLYMRNAPVALYSPLTMITPNMVLRSGAFPALQFGHSCLSRAGLVEIGKGIKDRGKAETMIVSCPSCATTGDMPEKSGLVRCHVCGHEWTVNEEGIAETPIPMPARHAHVHRLQKGAHLADDEAEILAREALAAEEARRAREARLRQERRRWIALALFTLAMAMVLVSMPERVTQMLPGASRLYAKVGVPVHPVGFEATGVMATLGRTTGGEDVLTITGRIRNISGMPRKTPRLKFILRDANGKVLHEWEIEGKQEVLAAPGRPLQFATRLAHPPKGVHHIEVKAVPRS